ncbi:MAG: YndJ family transporter [Sandaracinaceae bacterium]
MAAATARSVEGKAASARTLLLRSALVGLGASLTLRFLGEPFDEPVPRLLALCVLTVVPLSVAAAPPAGGHALTLLRLIAPLQPLVAVLTVGAFLRPEGYGTPWIAPAMGLGLLAAAYGAFRFFEGAGSHRVEAVTAAAALAFLPVGAVWLIAERADYPLLGFDRAGVEVHAVHVHVAAVAVPLLAVRAARALPAASWPRRVAAGAGLTLVVTPVVLALGQVTTPLLTLIATVASTGALLLLAVVELRWVTPRLSTRAGRALLVLSALSSVVAMPLAVLWVVGAVRLTLPFDPAWMLRVHGFANAHGVAVAGLVAWALEDRQATRGPATART